MAKIADVQEVSLKMLKPYERNAKKHGPDQVEKLKASILEFGFLTPCLIDRDYNIIAGHGRVMAAKDLGLESVPCVFIEGLTDEQRRAYILADNRLGELGEWDFDLVVDELAELDELGFDIELTGFDMPEEIPEVIEDDFDEDSVPDEPRCKLGDLWQLGDHRLICGDSTDVNVIERLIGGVTIDLVLTDPPYGIDAVSDDGKVGADFGVAKKGIYSKVIADDTTETAEQAIDILLTICDRAIIWGGNYFLDFLPTSDGWVVWDKRNDTGIRNTFADGEMAWCSFHTPVRIYHQLWNGMIREGEHEKRVHPTQKPIRMLSEILHDFSDEDNIILDVFGGSGSTLIACEQLHRKCFMCELDSYYCDVIINRWETLTGREAVLING